MKDQDPIWRRVAKSEEGQDLVEYSLLLAFIVLAGAASYLGIADSVDTIWTVMNSRLGEANQIIN